MKQRLTPKGRFTKIENMYLIKGYVVNGIEVRDMLNRLAELEDMIENGKLIELKEVKRLYRYLDFHLGSGELIGNVLNTAFKKYL